MNHSLREETIVGKNFYIWQGGDGTEHYFAKSGTLNWACPQLERGCLPGPFNMVSDGDFSRSRTIPQAAHLDCSRNSGRIEATA